MSTPSPQDVESTGRAAYDAACQFVGLPTIADQVAAAVAVVQQLLDDANLALAKANAALTTAKVDAQADVAASQKVLTDLGG